MFYNKPIRPTTNVPDISYKQNFSHMMTHSSLTCLARRPSLSVGYSSISDREPLPCHALVEAPHPETPETELQLSHENQVNSNYYGNQK